MGTSATVPLPSNFHEIQENPQLLDSSGTWNEFEVIEVEQKYEKSSGTNSINRFCYVMGDPSEGYNLIFNGLISGATMSVIYQRFPSGLATLSDISELPDPQYVARQIEQYVLLSRSDERYPLVKEAAQIQLANMMGREMKGSAGLPRSTKMGFDNPLKNLA